MPFPVFIGVVESSRKELDVCILNQSQLCILFITFSLCEEIKMTNDMKIKVTNKEKFPQEILDIYDVNTS